MLSSSLEHKYFKYEIMDIRMSKNMSVLIKLWPHSGSLTPLASKQVSIKTISIKKFGVSHLV